MDMVYSGSNKDSVMQLCGNLVFEHEGKLIAKTVFGYMTIDIGDTVAFDGFEVRVYGPTDS